VDRKAGVIHDVKVLGPRSKNGRRYTAEAIGAARLMYEGVSVRTNHPKRATDPRGVDEVLGQLRNVRMRGDSLYGDLHLLKSHPMFDRLCESAEEMSTLWGLSHNAEGQVEQVGGEAVVTKILEVRSVDLVADPATVDGLFESNLRRAAVQPRRAPTPMTTRSFVEHIAPQQAEPASTTNTVLRLLVQQQAEARRRIREGKAFAKAIAKRQD
jgi:hypothetical protein